MIRSTKQHLKRYNPGGGYDLKPIEGINGLAGSPTFTEGGLSPLTYPPSLAGTGLGIGRYAGRLPFGGINTAGYGGQLGVSGYSGTDLFNIGQYGRTSLGYGGLGSGIYNVSGRYGGFGSGIGDGGYGLGGVGGGLLGLGASLLSGFGGIGTLGYPAGRRWYGYYNSPYIYYNRRPFVYY